MQFSSIHGEHKAVLINGMSEVMLHALGHASSRCHFVPCPWSAAARTVDAALGGVLLHGAAVQNASLSHKLNISKAETEPHNTIRSRVDDPGGSLRRVGHDATFLCPRLPETQ